VITALVAVGVPLCCCNFRALFSSCDPCERAIPASVSEVHADGHGHDHVSEHGDQATLPVDQDAKHCPAPCEPGHEDDGQCSCGKHDLQLSSVEKSTLNVDKSISAIAELFSVRTNAWPTAAIKLPVWESWALTRPPTSLLRLHCALTV